MTVPNFSRAYWWELLAASWRTSRAMLDQSITRCSSNIRSPGLIQVIGSLIQLDNILVDFLALTSDQKLAVQELGREDTPDPTLDLVTLCTEAHAGLTQIIALAKSTIPTQDGYILERQWVEGEPVPEPRLIAWTSLVDLKNALTALKTTMYPA